MVPRIPKGAIFWYVKSQNFIKVVWVFNIHIFDHSYYLHNSIR